MRLPPIRRTPRRQVLPPEVGGECVFCAILAGRAESSTVLDDGKGPVAFLDLAPAVEGHTLVVPRRHVVDLAGLTPEEGAAMWELGRRVAAAARGAGLAEGVNLFLADGVTSGQEVLHVHLHVLPRMPGSVLRLDAARPVERSALDATAARLRAALPGA
ncbi:hypothetical protein GCM10023201_40600 [Actinomycetospora corticicola]|uniref:Diadenosine tetraphosphate (Ap4A) HIT family hydrolase n=1 Tax=Actinomycetospora corticicola TaxID=663602 RepID=A0A7Y9DWT7_9PSEU|nr:HIT domain-containing protein [Actinomycetospora corticicola]NYD36856.1 diadenosine tetraphosphate (Ap4A) HIT family hydrolase [Actinomycetospora corticicola]